MRVSDDLQISLQPEPEPESETDLAAVPSTPEQDGLVVLLSTVPERAVDLAAGVDGERLQYRHGPAFPTLQELIDHLAEAGTRVDALFRHAYLDHQRELNVREAVDPPFQASSGRPAGEALEGFARDRRRTIDMLRGLTEADWNRPLQDPREGEVTLLGIARLVATHELAHLAQLRNLIAVLPESQDLGPVGGGPQPLPGAAGSGSGEEDA